MSNGKRLLVVQYTFPPLGGAGVQRVLKFVKYLVGHRMGGEGADDGITGLHGPRPLARR